MDVFVTPANSIRELAAIDIDNQSFVSINDGEEECSNRIISVSTDIQREFMNIVIRFSPDMYEGQTHTQSVALVVCNTSDGPFRTKWAVHFYPMGHPSSYMRPPDFYQDDQKYASLYVRLQDAPTDMVEARITATVVNKLDKMESTITNNMENLMLHPRNKIDEFIRGTSGHGWPKIFSVHALKHFKEDFGFVVTLQIVKPAHTFNAKDIVSKIEKHQIYRHILQPQEQASVKIRTNHISCDAILQATDWQSVKAHRFVLAAGSGFFRRILEDDHGVPFVFRTQNSIEELHLLLDMMYLGRIPKRTFHISEEILKLTEFYELHAVGNALQEESTRILERRTVEIV